MGEERECEQYLRLAIEEKPVTLCQYASREYYEFVNVRLMTVNTFDNIRAVILNYCCWQEIS